MTPPQRLAAVAALLFFGLLNFGTSAPEQEGPDPSQPAAQPPAAAPRTFSCNRVAETRCQQYEMGPDDDLLIRGESMLCAERNGTWGEAPCPVDDRLGSCAISDSTWHFYPDQWTADDARQLCESLQNGTWTAAP